MKQEALLGARPHRAHAGGRRLTGEIKRGRILDNEDERLGGAPLPRRGLMGREPLGWPGLRMIEEPLARLHKDLLARDRGGQPNHSPGVMPARLTARPQRRRGPIPGTPRDLSRV